MTAETLSAQAGGSLMTTTPVEPQGWVRMQLCAQNDQHGKLSRSAMHGTNPVGNHGHVVEHRRMEPPGAQEDGHLGEPPKIYAAVFRAAPPVRFRPEDVFETWVVGVPECNGPVRVQARTRWVDEGHESPTPRELWIDIRGPVSTLDHAGKEFERLAIHLANIASFVANVSSGTPEVHIIYDATVEATSREFLEVFLPDERGSIREGRIVNIRELQQFFTPPQDSPPDTRIGSAIYKYCQALAHWRLGSESLALSFLYMAAETLTKAVIRFSCAQNQLTEIELATQQGIDVSEADKWKHPLDVWARRDVIFDGDNEVYRDARRASDGMEHGFLTLDEVQAKAIAVTARTFSYVRRAILRIAGVSAEEFPELYNRHPKDVESLRKVIRGIFEGDGSDPASESQEYPMLTWHSHVDSFKRDNDSFKLSLRERYTAQCSPSYTFTGTGFELRGRVEPGHPALETTTTLTLSQIPPTEGSQLDEALGLLRKVHSLASETFQSSQTHGFSARKEQAVAIFIESISLAESIELLVKDKRPVEAAILLRSIFLGASRLQTLAASKNPDGVALRLRADTVKHFAKIARNTEAVGELERRMQTLAQTEGLVIPDEAPPLTDSDYFRENEAAIQYTELIAQGDGVAGAMHMNENKETETLEASTQISEGNHAETVALDTAEALLIATSALAASLDWHYDSARAAALTSEGKQIAAQLDQSA